MIDELLFDDLPLAEVVEFLNKEVRKKDPDGKGISFFINPHVDNPPSITDASAPGVGGGTPPLLDAFGQPIGAPFGATNLNNAVISISPPLRDLILADALDAINKTADSPIKFIVEDYAIVFTQKSSEPTRLFTSVFKVDP